MARPDATTATVSHNTDTILALTVTLVGDDATVQNSVTITASAEEYAEGADTLDVSDINVVREDDSSLFVVPLPSGKVVIFAL
ncbi:MAG: hypothetical protein ACI9LY_002100 [Arenicella sp.]